MGSASNNAPKNAWKFLSKVESKFDVTVAEALEKLEVGDNAFVSFHFRSLTLPGSRKDTIHCSINNTNVDDSPVHERLLLPYVRACGRSRTLNSLLTARAGSIPAFEIGESDSADIEIQDSAVRLLLPSAFWGQGLVDRKQILRWWHEQKGTWSYEDLRRSSMQALLALWRDSPTVLEKLCGAVLRTSAADLDPLGVERLRHWVAALVALWPFISLFGFPFRVQLVDHPGADTTPLNYLNLEPMPSALTTIGGEEATSSAEEACAAACKTTARELNSVDEQVFWRYHHDAVNDLKKLPFKNGTPEKRITDAVWEMTEKFPDIPSILRIAEALAGAQDEKRPLSFIFLCGLETEVLRDHSSAGGDREIQWMLAKVLDLRQPGTEPDSGSVATDIKKNASLLQVPGRALFFGPTDASPDSIVDISPFDSTDEVGILRQYTKDSGGGVAVLVSAAGIRVLAKGNLILRGRGNPIRWQLEDEVDAETITDRVMQIAPTFTGDEVADRLRMAAKVAVRVKEKGLGCLIFLEPGQKNADSAWPTRHPMADLWLYQDPAIWREIEGVNDEVLLALAAGMDGETYVDLASGRFAVRLEHVVPEDEMFALHQLELGQNEDPWGVSFNDFTWEEYTRSMPTDPGELALSSRQELESLGTRHMKALRITRAFPDVVAITVSSDGPLRIWKAGYAYNSHRTRRPG